MTRLRRSSAVAAPLPVKRLGTAGTVLAAVVSCSSATSLLDRSAVQGTRLRSGLPIESVLLRSDEDLDAKESKLRLAVDACMRSRGFDYESPVPPVVGESIFSLRSRYGSLDGVDVSKWGYRDERSVILNEFAKSVPPLSQAEVSALVGEAPQVESLAALPNLATADCSSVARAEVYGASNGISGLVGYQGLIDLQIQSSDRLYSSPEGRAAVDEWSECMRAAGFAFSHWFDPILALGVDQSSRANISADEVLTATADQRCRAESDLESRLLETESAIQRRMLDEQQPLVELFLAAYAKEAKGFAAMP